MPCLPRRRRRCPRATRAGWATAIAVVVLSACTGVDGTDPPGDVERTGVAVGEETDLSVLTYNIEYSGDRSTDAVIEDIDADVVGVLSRTTVFPRSRRGPAIPTTTSGSSCCRSTPSTNPRVPTASLR